MKYNTAQEAQKAADMENAGRDYGTAVVRKEGGFYILKII